MKKETYHISKENLMSAVKNSTLGNAQLQQAIIYTKGPINAEKCRKYNINILNKTNEMALVKYHPLLRPYLYALDDVIHVQYQRQLYPVLDTSRVLCRINEAHLASAPRYVSGPYKGKNVLIGIIDTEFDTRHPAFLDSNSVTRFIALWDQNDSTNSKNNQYGYGTIKFKNELTNDTAFGTKGSFHGTLMAAAATGSDLKSGFYGAAPEALLAGVCYDYSNDLSLINAIAWIFSLADSIGVPCVISMSIGVSAGPHDGTSELDSYIDKVSAPGRIIVGAAGNDGEARAHVLFNLEANTEPLGTWITPQTNTTDKDTFYTWRIDLWGEPQNPFQLSTQLFSNNKNQLYEETSFITVGNKRDIYKPDTVVIDGDTIFWFINAERSSLNSKPHAEITVFGENPDYRVGIRVQSATTTKIHGWNMHKKSLEDFDMDHYVTGDNNYSINEVGGTSKSIIAVGSYMGRSALKLWNGEIIPGGEKDTILKLAGFSGRGPTVDGRIKPDITAPGIKVVSAMSSHISEWGRTVYWPFHPKPYGWYGPATGTSISAPIVAGTVALLLQADPTLTCDKVRTALQISASKDQFTGPLTKPDNTWGGGKLNAIGALDYVLGLPPALAQNRIIVSKNLKISVNSHTIHIDNLPKNSQIQFFDLFGRIVRTSTGENNLMKMPEMNGDYILICKYDGRIISTKKILLTE
jgi:subtilisin family serine protease